MPEEAKWYVVHTYSGYENKVASTLMKTVENHNLQDLIQRVCVPTEMVPEEKTRKVVKEIDGKKVKVEEKIVETVERKIFPGYVIIKMVMTDESWYVVRNIRGCTGFVGPSSKPVPLTDEEVRKLGVENEPEQTADAAAEAEEVKPVMVSFAVGDIVRINNDLFAGDTGRVEEINPDKGIVKLMVNFFGKDTITEIPLDEVEVIDDYE